MEAQKQEIKPVPGGKGAGKRVEGAGDASKATNGEAKTPRDRTSKNFDGKATIQLLVDKNPKREGSKSHARFAFYKSGQTVEDFIKAGGTYGDLAWDAARGYVGISGYTPKAVVKKEPKAKEAKAPAVEQKAPEGGQKAAV